MRNFNLPSILLGVDNMLIEMYIVLISLKVIVINLDQTSYSNFFCLLKGKSTEKLKANNHNDFPLSLITFPTSFPTESQTLHKNRLAEGLTTWQRNICFLSRWNIPYTSLTILGKDEKKKPISHEDSFLPNVEKYDKKYEKQRHAQKTT